MQLIICKRAAYVRPDITVDERAAHAMYIEEITLEGFKSYATRVTVPSFDPFFNAITGLNGSGKSNILDSICFVLGITNLSQAR